MNLLNLIIMALATWYVAETITSKAGPFEIFARTRKALPLGGLMICIYCMVPWIAVVMFAMNHFIPEVVWIFAIAGAALMLRSYTGVQHG